MLAGIENFGVFLFHSKGLSHATGKQRAAVWTLAPFHAIHDAFQSGFFQGSDMYRDETGGEGDQPDPADLKFGIRATAVTSLFQGPATYAAVFGLGLLCSTYIGGLAGTITHGVLSGIVGAWFSGGRAFSGLASGLLIGVGVFALQTYGLHALSELLGLSDLNTHLVAGAATILATFLIESLAQVITRKTGENTLFGQEYTDCVEYKSEYVLFYQVGQTWDKWVARCKNCGKAGTEEGYENEHERLM